MHHLKKYIICILIDIVIGIFIKDTSKYTSFRDRYYKSNNLNLNIPNNYNNPDNHNNNINLKLH